MNDEKCLNYPSNCFDLYNCCSCGNNDCGCRYCFDCKACEECKKEE